MLNTKSQYLYRTFETTNIAKCVSMGASASFFLENPNIL